MKQTRDDQMGRALEAALRHLELDTAISELLVGALERIVNRTYGRCARCSGQIAGKRLMALPWARLCGACQDALDAVSERS